MITDFLPAAGQIVNHWTVVIGVALTFFIVQITLSVRLYLRARRQDRLLRRLCRELQRGGDGRRNPDELPCRFSWLEWVLSRFPEESSAPEGNFTRDEVLHELDTRMASEASYLLLQRMGIMAPLLGVVLTVVGFYWLKIDESGEQSLQTILVAVTPLVSGVGAGAILALVNQALLQGVGARMERLRMSARTWFDGAIWRHVGLDAQAATAKAIVAIDKFARTVADAADRHMASTGRIEATSASMKLAATQFEDVVRSFHGEIKGVPQAPCVLRDATAASAKALEELLPVGARAIANLDVSVAAFRTTVDREFADAATLHNRSSRSLANAVEQILESTEALKSGADHMKQAAETNAATVQKSDEALAGAADGLAGASNRLRHAIESDVAPSQETLHAAAESFANSADQLSAFIEHGLDPAAGKLAEFHDTLAGLAETVDAIRKFSHARPDIDRLTETLARAAVIADAISALPEQIRDIVEANASQAADLAAARGRRPWLLGRSR